MGFIRHALGYFYPELLATASLENPATPLSSYDQERQIITGVNVTEETALGAGTYYACLKELGETLAQMDMEVVETVGKATSANTPHPTYWLLHAEPSPRYGRGDWVRAMVIWA